MAHCSIREDDVAAVEMFAIVAFSAVAVVVISAVSGWTSVPGDFHLFIPKPAGHYLETFRQTLAGLP